MNPQPWACNADCIRSFESSRAAAFPRFPAHVSLSRQQTRDLRRYPWYQRINHTHTPNKHVDLLSKKDPFVSSVNPSGKDKPLNFIRPSASLRFAATCSVQDKQTLETCFLTWWCKASSPVRPNSSVSTQVIFYDVFCDESESFVEALKSLKMIG